jgi:phosphosulfolactate synthase (CoM biosynthesis protein A)
LELSRVMSALCQKQTKCDAAKRVSTWRTDVVARIIDELGLDRVMFEAADPPVFEWYIKNYGNEVNLFVDHSQIVQLEALRSGIWGTKSTWGRIQNLND